MRDAAAHTRFLGRRHTFPVLALNQSQNSFAMFQLLFTTGCSAVWMHYLAKVATNPATPPPLVIASILQPGSIEVRADAAKVRLICTAAHGRVEFASAAFRKVREGGATPDDCRLALAQMRTDAASGNLQFLPLTDAVFERLETVYSSANTGVYLPAADAIHLGTAAENGFAAIHSNDGHLLAAAPLFGIRGVNVI